MMFQQNPAAAHPATYVNRSNQRQQQVANKRVLDFGHRPIFGQDSLIKRIKVEALSGKIFPLG
jgi:hypothetical protein